VYATSSGPSREMNPGRAAHRHDTGTITIAGALIVTDAPASRRSSARKSVRNPPG
jgi:hypothetical protein